jgi:hypothetical protein
LLNVGFLNDFVTVGQLNLIRLKLAEREKQIGTGSLFSWEKIDDPTVNSYVEELWSRLVNEKRIDTGEVVLSSSKKGKRAGWETIDTNTVSHSDVREMGAEWLCYQAPEQLVFAGFLRSLGWRESDVLLAQTHLISRAVYPASELCTARWIAENSSVCELTGFPVDRINKDALYRISKKLYHVHELTENYLSVKTNELFDIEDKIVIYDLTNTCFEGPEFGSLTAKHGRSKEKRSDAKLIVLGLVVNRQGFIKYSQLLEGNVSDAVTLKKVVSDLRNKTSSSVSGGVVVIDAGIATEANLTMLRENGFDYICVSHSSLKEYQSVEGSGEICVEDQKKRIIRLKKVFTDKNDDYCLKVERQSK